MKTLREKGDRVLILTGGKGAFALHQAKGSDNVQYFEIDTKTFLAHTIDEGRFRSALGLNQTQSQEMKEFEENRFLDENSRLVWRYFLSAFSDSSRQVLDALVKKAAKEGRHPKLQEGLDKLLGSLPESMDRIFGSELKDSFIILWELGDQFELLPTTVFESTHTPGELDALLKFHKIGCDYRDGDVSHRIFTIEGEEYRYVKEEGHSVFRRLSNSEKKAHSENENRKIGQTRISGIAGIIDRNEFPEKIYSIPSNDLDALDEVLSPGGSSITGFKQKDESLLELIQRDASTIQNRGYTHQQLAKWLTDIIERDKRQVRSFSINGRTYEIVPEYSQGPQESPFGDHALGSRGFASTITWNNNYTVIDKESGRRVKFSGGHPYMIGYYGFFEGDVPYRLDPAELIDLIEGK